MTKQTSIQKGDTLEKKVYDLLVDLLANDEFFVNGKKSKVFLKKPYYSEKRKGNVIFDVTIETYLDGATNYSMLTIFECKNLNRKVSVDDVEEFNSKVDGVGEHNTKAIIVSSNSFQEGAYNYAVSQKMGLIKINSNDKFDWINYRKSVGKTVIDGLSHTYFVSEDIRAVNFVSIIDGNRFENFASILLECDIIDYYVHKERFINVPFISEVRIDEIIKRLYSYDIQSFGRLDSDKLCNFLATVYPVSFEFDSFLSNNQLGKIEFEPVRIYVTKDLRVDNNRWRFTLCHEIGHLILHHKYFQDRLNEKTDDQFSLSFTHFITDMTIRRIELQANIFASHLLLPFSLIEKTVATYFTLQRIHKGYLYLDHQPVNQKLAFGLLNKISREFEVSVEVAKIRLIQLGLLEDVSDQSLRSILKSIGWARKPR